VDRIISEAKAMNSCIPNKDAWLESTQVWLV